MQKAFRIEADGRLTEVSADQVLLSASDAKTSGAQGEHHWVDLTNPSDDELGRWLEACAIPTFASELALGAIPTEALGNQASAAWVAEEGAFFFFPFYGSDSAIPERFSGICAPRLLLTYHHSDSAALSAAERLGQEGNVLPLATHSGVVAVLMRFMSNRNSEAAAELRQRMSRVADQLARGDVAPDLDAILKLGTELDALSDTIDEQLIAIRTLSVANSESLDFQDLQQHINVSTTNLEVLSRSLDRVDRHVGTLRAQYDSRLTERTNRRLATLTVLSAVFLPLTFITGIYGMNFQFMPELDAPWGYPVTLAAMGCVACLMFTYFWKRGWFD